MKNLYIVLLAIIICGVCYCSKNNDHSAHKNIGPTKTLRPLIMKTFELFGKNEFDQYLNECYITRQEIKTLLSKYEYDGLTNEKYTNDRYSDILERKKIAFVHVKAANKVYNFRELFSNAHILEIENEQILNQQSLSESSQSEVVVRFANQNKKFEVRFSCSKTEKRGWVMRGGLLTLKRL